MLVAAGYLGWTQLGRAGYFSDDALYDIELVAGQRNESVQFFTARSGWRASAQSIREAAAAICLERVRTRPKPEACAVAILSSADAISVSDFKSAWSIVGDRWKKSEISAIYIWDEDSSTARHRSDEIFVVDCAIFDRVVQTENIVCKGSQEDKLSRELGRNAAQQTEAALDEVQATEPPTATHAAAAASDDAVAAAVNATGFGTFYVIADANRRIGATAASVLVGKVARGTILQGMIIIGSDGTSKWLSLADGNGFISSVNVAQSPPPELATNLDERRFSPPFNLQLHAAPSDQAPVIDTVPAGTALVITGITSNGFAEAKGRSGGVGYFRAEGFDFSR